MGSGKRSKNGIRNPSSGERLRSGTGGVTKTKKNKFKTKNNMDNNSENIRTKDSNELNNKNDGSICVASATPAELLRFFINQYQSANAIQLSALELESITDKCILELSQGLAQNASNLGEHIKASFGSSWKEVLCEKQLIEGKIDPGSPAVLVISLSALRSLELQRGLRTLTRECPAAKLFSKHMKIEDQVVFLKNRVNIASGTPNRIKKLIDLEALSLSRLEVIVLDLQKDVKGYSLFTLPQVRHEFWDLYKSYFHPRIVEGSLRICLYGHNS
ncbi:hypothetical protein NMG60_11028239 [Bertholletia excelsa]